MLELGLNQSPRKPLARLKQPILHRANRNIQHRGDFRQIHLLEIMQDDNRSQGFVKSSHGIPHFRSFRIDRQRLCRIWCRILPE